MQSQSEGRCSFPFLGWRVGDPFCLRLCPDSARAVRLSSRSRDTSIVLRIAPRLQDTIQSRVAAACYINDGDCVGALIRLASGDRAVPVLVGSAALHDGDGVVTGAIAALQDITLLKELDRARQEFLGAAAHDLKTPPDQRARAGSARASAPDAAGFTPSPAGHGAPGGD